MSELQIIVLALVLAALFVVPFGITLNESRKAKVAEINYLTRRALECPPPPPRPRDFSTPAAYFDAAAAWDKRFTTYCRNYPA